MNFDDYTFCFDEKKNTKLKIERGVSFEDVISILQNNSALDIIKHPNKNKYLNQKIFVIEKNNYIYAVPYV